MPSLLRNATTLLFLGSLSCLASSAEHFPTAAQSLSCVPRSVVSDIANTCPYPFEIEQADPAFQSALDHAIRQLPQSVEGPQTPVKPVQAGRHTYLYATLCQQHNCGNIWLGFLYQPQQNRMVALYRDEEAAPPQQLFIGQPTSEEKQVLEQPPTD